MPLITDTGTDRDFPDGAVEERDAAGLLLSVKSAGGWTLWKAKEEGAGRAAQTTRENHADLGHAIGIRADGSWWCRTCTKAKREESIKTAAKAATVVLEGVGVDKLMTDEQPMPDAISTTPDLPEPIIKAIVMVLGNAQYQTIRAGEDLRMADYFHGLLFGAHAVIGIIAGGLGYNTDFMLDEQPERGDNHHDHSQSVDSSSAAVNHSPAH